MQCEDIYDKEIREETRGHRNYPLVLTIYVAKKMDNLDKLLKILFSKAKLIINSNLNFLHLCTSLFVDKKNRVYDI